MTEQDRQAEELRAIDEALRVGAATAAGEQDRALALFALELAAQAPEPDPDFSARLGERVHRGFESGPSRLDTLKSKLPRPTLRWPSMPVLAGVASVLVALAVAIPLIGHGSDGSSGGSSAAVERAPSTDPAVPQRPSRVGPAEGDSAGSEFAPGKRERRIARSAMLTLAAPASKLDKVADEIVAVTDRYDGFVLRSSISTGAAGSDDGQFELRVPAGALRPALGALSKLGDVRARSQQGEDVTSTFISASDQLQAARAARRGLLRRLEHAGTDNAADALRRRLDLNATEISRLRGALRSVRISSDYATIELSLERTHADGAATVGEDHDGIAGALGDALGSLSGSVEVLIRVLGFALPFGLLLAAAAFAARLVRRRRRDAALS